MAEIADRTDILGIDIGGANLKYATEDGRCFDRSFAMWTHWRELTEQLVSDIAHFVGVRHLAVTMTGELADCFPKRAVGVSHIVDHVMQCLPRCALESASFYGTDGRFYGAADATQNWERIAASNWHALASCIGKRIAADALLIDVGSTTTDVIAISGGQVLTESRTDFERLADQSLVYIGCRRTPVCALVSQLDFGGKSVPVMKEGFATIDDARLWLGLQAEAPEDLGTADGQPRDCIHARSRLARMVALDRDQISDNQVTEIALQIVSAASRPIVAAADHWWQRLVDERRPSPSQPAAICVLSGHGQDLAVSPGSRTIIDLQTELPPGMSRVAPAWAVAVLHR